MASSAAAPALPCCPSNPARTGFSALDVADIVVLLRFMSAAGQVERCRRAEAGSLTTPLRRHLVRTLITSGRDVSGEFQAPGIWFQLKPRSVAPIADSRLLAHLSQ